MQAEELILPQFTKRKFTGSCKPKTAEGDGLEALMCTKTTPGSGATAVHGITIQVGRTVSRALVRDIVLDMKVDIIPTKSGKTLIVPTQKSSFAAA